MLRKLLKNLAVLVSAGIGFVFMLAVSGLAKQVSMPLLIVVATLVLVGSIGIFSLCYVLMEGAIERRSPHKDCSGKSE